MAIIIIPILKKAWASFYIPSTPNLNLQEKIQSSYTKLKKNFQVKLDQKGCVQKRKRVKGVCRVSRPISLEPETISRNTMRITIWKSTKGKYIENQSEFYRIEIKKELISINLNTWKVSLDSFILTQVLFCRLIRNNYYFSRKHNISLTPSYTRTTFKKRSKSHDIFWPGPN